MMKTQRRGSDLRIHIRIALVSLGRDKDSIDTSRMSIAEMEKLHKELFAEYKARKAAQASA